MVPFLKRIYLIGRITYRLPSPFQKELNMILWRTMLTLRKINTCSVLVIQVLMSFSMNTTIFISKEISWLTSWSVSVVRFRNRRYLLSPMPKKWKQACKSINTKSWMNSCLSTFKRIHNHRILNTQNANEKLRITFTSNVEELLITITGTKDLRKIWYMC